MLLLPVATKTEHFSPALDQFKAKMQPSLRPTAT